MLERNVAHRIRGPLTPPRDRGQKQTQHSSLGRGSSPTLGSASAGRVHGYGGAPTIPWFRNPQTRHFHVYAPNVFGARASRTFLTQVDEGEHCDRRQGRMSGFVFSV